MSCGKWQSIQPPSELRNQWIFKTRNYLIVFENCWSCYIDKIVFAKFTFPATVTNEIQKYT